MKSLIKAVVEIVATIVISVLIVTIGVLALGVFIEWWMIPLMDWAFADKPFPFF